MMMMQKKRRKTKIRSPDYMHSLRRPRNMLKYQNGIRTRRRTIAGQSSLSKDSARNETDMSQDIRRFFQDILLLMTETYLDL